jgi:hypothetical protein
MNAHGSFYSVVVINQPKKIMPINTKQIKYFRSVSQENNGGKINGNINIHCSSSADHGFGCSRSFLVCSIHVHPSARLLVDRVCGSLGRGG